ncbi:hypothetical protein [Clostridioides difficile]|uniref:hypothetical protein n=1 Tax=Clostridioides difficile TaxID=1496 RepID=UPI001F43710E|nr:hypothetical protein [Clostridioides difficile]
MEIDIVYIILSLRLNTLTIGKINSVPVEVEFLEPIYDHIENPRLKSSVLGENIKNKMINTIENFRKSNKTFKEF